MFGELFYIEGDIVQSVGNDNSRLLILLNENHLSTVLYDPLKKLVFEWGMLELPVDMQNREEAVKEYFNNHHLVSKSKEGTALLSLTGRQTIIPLSLSDPKHIAIFAQLQFPCGKEDLLLTDKDQSSNTAVIYSPEQPVYTGLKRLFPTLPSSHLFHLILKQPATEEPILTIHILPSRCLITFQHQEKWQLLQSYHYQSGEDILFLLLKTMDQLGTQPADTIVSINGLVDSNSSLAKLIEQYIPVLQWGAELHFSYPASEGFDRHTFSLIDSVLTCVS